MKKEQSLNNTVLVVSLPGSSKREKMAKQLSSQGISWQWVDGVVITCMDEIPLWERSDMEAYGVARLKEDPQYICRAVGCKRAMKNAIAQAAESFDDWVLILQDDVRLCEDFNSRLKTHLKSATSEMDAILLFRGGYINRSDRPLVRLSGDVRSMSAFLVRPNFARILDKELETWGGEDDRIWLRMISKGHMIMGSYPLLVTTNQKESDIIGGIPELRRFWGKQVS